MIGFPTTTNNSYNQKFYVDSFDSLTNCWLLY